jgi:hypothetical protein
MRGDESPMSKDEDEEELQEEQDEADEYGLQAWVRITTRCLWTDNGKLLEALQKAADLALVSCPKGARLSMVERHLGAVLRKVVQKYSNRRPEVIVIATDSSEAVGVNKRTPQRHQTPRDIWSGFSIDSKVGSIEGPAPRDEVRPAVETIPSSVESASPSVVREIPAVDPIEDGVQFVTAPAVEAISAVKNVAVKAISAVESVVSNDDGVDAASLHPSPKSVGILSCIWSFMPSCRAACFAFWNCVTFHTKVKDFCSGNQLGLCVTSPQTIFVVEPFPIHLPVLIFRPRSREAAGSQNFG